jgi:hypothetical protein
MVDLLCPRYFDRQGFPIPGDLAAGIEPVIAWARVMEAATSDGSRFIAQSDFPDHSLLSTVWLGLDQNFGGRPLFFETMYFDGEEKEATLPTGGTFTYHESLEFPDPESPDEMTTQLRYGSEESALAGHHGVERLLRKRWLV